MKYVIYWSKRGTCQERRLPWEMTREQAEALCKILDSFFSKDYTHEVRQLEEKK